MRLEWDTKAFLKSLVMTSAYRQISSVSAARYEEDPDNLYVSRGPRFRATAEQIRDASLAASGLLSHKLFGPPTRPPQPSMGLSAAFGSRTDWDTSQVKTDSVADFIRNGDDRIPIRLWRLLMPPIEKSAS